MRKARYLSINSKGHMEFAGCDTVDLAKQYGTPLYVMSEEEIRLRCREVKMALSGGYPKTRILYASKAFSCKEMCRIVSSEGIDIDIVSSGEMYTALEAGVSPDRISFNGNNKTTEELEYAISNNIGHIIIDSFYEIELIQKIAAKYDKKIDALLRISPGVSGHTHESISTGQLDSKFGFPIEFGIAIKAVGEVIDAPNINFKGIHCHIGSQMSRSEVYEMGSEKMVGLLADIKKVYNVNCEELNIGGGFGVYYTNADEALPIKDFMNTIIKGIKPRCEAQGLTLPTILIEPGRWLSGEAGITLYTIGAIKEIPNIRKYVSVDGGMADNIRPALYQAEYEGVVANKADKPCTEKVTIAGKCCESGDMLIHDAMVPPIESGDIFAILTTGAYSYSMASNYNRLRKPAVVFVSDGKSRLVIRRETHEDLVKTEI